MPGANPIKRLIVNADDFGLTLGVNRAICFAHERGIVTSTTLMTIGPRLDDALSRAQDLARSGLSIGCHVVLVDGKPASSDIEIPTLLLAPGLFRAKLKDWNAAVLRGRVNEREVQTEAAAQIRLLQRRGVTISHLDTHKHTHWLPGVFRPLLLAARACGIPAIRNPFAPRVSWTQQLLRRGYSWKQYAKIRLLRSFASEFASLAMSQGLNTTDGILGVFDLGLLNLESFRRIMAALPDGTWEMCCHPGFNDGDLAQVKTTLRERRERELALLTSTKAREILEENGIQLISFAELASSQSPVGRSAGGIPIALGEAALKSRAEAKTEIESYTP